MTLKPHRCTVSGKLAPDRPGAPTDEKLPDGQHADHFVLCPEDRAKGYVEPLRLDYIHQKCGTVTTMPRACAETYAAQPEYYGSTFCCGCGGYYPVGAEGEFIWNDGRDQKVGTRRYRPMSDAPTISLEIIIGLVEGRERSIIWDPCRGDDSPAGYRIANANGTVGDYVEPTGWRRETE